jgi:hypothetical protein
MTKKYSNDPKTDLEMAVFNARLKRAESTALMSIILVLMSIGLTLLLAIVNSNAL